jgi:translation initiation factor 2B subunit (eIF-2B alpha/beta/delta family)
MAARVLSAADPSDAALRAAVELEEDRTERHLAAAVPDSATVVVIGWPEATAGALRRRGDIEVLVVDSSGEGSGLARRLANAGSDCEVVPNSGVGPAAAVADLVLVEAFVAGPGGVLAAPGSLPAAAVASHSGRPVWLVTPTGRVLPESLWDALLNRFDDTAGEPWDRGAELVPATLATDLIGPEGPAPVDEGLSSATCPVAPELLRAAG